MKNDLILSENFWQKYRLTFDYDTMKVRIRFKKNEFIFASIDNQFKFKILKNQSFAAEKINRRIFERIVKKSAKVYLYVVRKANLNENVVENFTKLTLLQRIIEHSKLNKVLKFDSLKIFKNDLSDDSSSKKPQNYDIDTDNAKSINKSLYFLFKKQLDEQTTQIDYLLKKKLVRFNISFWKFSVLFVKKKNEKWKMCINYKTFNAVTFKNGYSLSKIQDCLNMIKTAKTFNKIDLTSEYWQINVLEKNRHKTAFNIRKNKYEFCVMLFELINASTTFQTVINDMLRFFLNKFVVIYLNDILIYFKNDEKHYEHVKLVMKAFRKNDYYAKPSKCVFFSEDHWVLRSYNKKRKSENEWNQVENDLWLIHASNCT